MSNVTLHPVISLWQPWASWVAWSWKPIETRLHPRFESLQGKTIGIHAAQTWDVGAIRPARRYLSEKQIRRTAELYSDWPRGVIVCTAFCWRHDLTEPHDAEQALIECETHRYGLFLENTRPLNPPFAVKGRQGIFNVEIPEEAMAA